MIRMSRRNVIAGALAVPAIAGLARLRTTSEGRAVLMHDPSLEAGRRFAAAASPGISVPIEGDRVRFVRGMLAESPSLVAGVTRYADMLLIADIAREAGYSAVSTIHVRHGLCSAAVCRPGWDALARVAGNAGSAWADALARFTVRQGGGEVRGRHAKAAGAPDRDLVLGWVLAPRRSLSGGR